QSATSLCCQQYHLPCPTPPSPYLFFFPTTPPPDTYTLSLHDALPICRPPAGRARPLRRRGRRRARSTRDRAARDRLGARGAAGRSEEHTSELQSLRHLVCRLLLEKKKKTKIERNIHNEQDTHTHNRRM